MNIRNVTFAAFIFAFASAFTLSLHATPARAQDDEATDAGDQLNDAADQGDYATQDATDGEDAAYNAGAVFDGDAGGQVQDPSTLTPSTGVVATPNE